TTSGCIGNYSHVRSDPIEDLGLDPCIPDSSRLRPAAIDVDPSIPVCPLRRLDGSQGPLMYVRIIGNAGLRHSLGNAEEAYAK
ncbi:hypothetical protein PMAYCL1PPCAC_15947, partial [Pristionchus mayeri]